VANTLTFLGYQPVWQDVFSTETGDLRVLLSQQIDCLRFGKFASAFSCSCRIPSDQARLLSKRWLSVSIQKFADYADFTDKKLPSVAAVYDRRASVFQNL
jgi:hypothetical protein